MRYVLGEADTNVISVLDGEGEVVNHGLRAGDRVYFTGLAGGDGLTSDTDYYVIAGGLTSSAFSVSETDGGAAVNFTSDITGGRMSRRLTAALRINRHRVAGGG